MSLLNLSLFIPACFALNIVPGPNNLLAMSNARRFGVKYALAAGFGRLVAFMGMIFLAASGLAVVLYSSETLFFTIKIVGAVYLFWIAFQLWRADISTAMTINKQEKNLRQLASQEFFLAAGNPKAILIFTAFLPQFIEATKPAELQFFILGITFLLLELVAIAIYTCFGAYLRDWFAEPPMRKLFNRTCATFIGAIGVNLLLERKS